MNIINNERLNLEVQAVLEKNITKALFETKNELIELGIDAIDIRVTYQSQIIFNLLETF